MTDIVERLREEARQGAEYGGHPEYELLVGEAADEIEKLRKAADFGLAVLWGSDGDKRGAIKYLEKALGK